MGHVTHLTAQRKRKGVCVCGGRKDEIREESHYFAFSFVDGTKTLKQSNLCSNVWRAGD